MTFRIDDFLARGLKFHGSRPINFEVQLSAPTSIIGPNILENATFLCNATQIPPSIVSFVEVAYFGRRMKIKGDRVFPNWTVNIMNDEDYALRSMFEAWHNGINAIQGNFMTLPTEAGPASYKQDLVVRQLSKEGFKSREYTIVGAFPVNVEPMQMNWETVNAIGQFSVEFAYDYWIHNDSVKYPDGNMVEYDPDPARPENT